MNENIEYTGIENSIIEKAQDMCKNFVEAVNRKDKIKAKQELFQIMTYIMEVIEDENRYMRESYLLSEIRAEIENDPTNRRKYDGKEMDELLPEKFWTDFLFDLIIVLDEEEDRIENNKETLRQDYEEAKKFMKEQGLA